MNTTDRNRKLLALGNLLNGDSRLMQQLKPQLVLDLDQLSPDELETLWRLQQRERETGRAEITLEQLEALLGRPLKLIPRPSNWTK